MDVKAGDTLIIPPGWVHAVATTAASLMVVGNFLLRESLTLHLEAWRIEVSTGLVRVAFVSFAHAVMIA